MPDSTSDENFLRSCGSRPYFVLKRAALGDHALDEREVAALEIVRVKLHLQRHQRRLVLGHDHDARGVLVEPVHDARPPLAADADERVAAVMQERVDQRARLVRRRRMHDHARRLVDDDEVRVFVDDRERNVLGAIFDGDRRRRRQHDALVRPHLARRRAHLAAGDGDLALLDAAR